MSFASPLTYKHRMHHAFYETRAQARADIFFYIEASYNRKRRHLTLEYVGPAAFEEAYYSNASFILCLSVHENGER